MQKYQWRKGSPFQALAKPEVVGQELERLYKTNGTLQPAKVVEAARPKKAPLHPCFTWENAVAADKWRIYEARNLCRSVEIISPERPAPEPLLVHITYPEDAGAKGYAPTRVAVQHVDMWTRVMTLAYQRLVSACDALSVLERIELDEHRTQRLSQFKGVLDSAIRFAKDEIDPKDKDDEDEDEDADDPVIKAD